MDGQAGVNRTGRRQVPRDGWRGCWLPLSSPLPAAAYLQLR